MKPRRAMWPSLVIVTLVLAAVPATAHDPAATVQPPILHNGDVIAVNGDGWVRGLDPATGQQRWAFSMGLEPLGPAVPAGDAVAVPVWNAADEESNVVGVSTNGVVWSVALPAFPVIVSAGPDDHVLAVTPDGNVTLIGADGTVGATTAVEGAGSGAAVFNGTHILVPTSDGRVVALDRDASTALAEHSIGDDRVKYIVAVDDGFLASVRAPGRTIDLVRVRDGAEAWRANMPGFQFGSAPAVRDGTVAGGNFHPDGARVFHWDLETGEQIVERRHAGDTAAAVVAHPDGFVELWNRALIMTDGNGNELWTVEFDQTMLAAPGVIEDSVIPGGSNNALVAYGPDGAERWRYEDNVTVAPWQDAHGDPVPPDTNGSPAPGPLGALLALVAGVVLLRRRH